MAASEIYRIKGDRFLIKNIASSGVQPGQKFSIYNNVGERIGEGRLTKVKGRWGLAQLKKGVAYAGSRVIASTSATNQSGDIPANIVISDSNSKNLSKKDRSNLQFLAGYDSRETTKMTSNSIASEDLEIDDTPNKGLFIGLGYEFHLSDLITSTTMPSLHINELEETENDGTFNSKTTYKERQIKLTQTLNANFSFSALRVQPFIGAGLGYNWGTAEFSDLDDSEFNAKADVYAYSGHVSAGINLIISERFMVHSSYAVERLRFHKGKVSAQNEEVQSITQVFLDNLIDSGSEETVQRISVGIGFTF
jgi:opacity protein-like surface antigen